MQIRQLIRLYRFEGRVTGFYETVAMDFLNVNPDVRGLIEKVDEPGMLFLFHWHGGYRPVGLQIDYKAINVFENCRIRLGAGNHAVHGTYARLGVRLGEDGQSYIALVHIQPHHIP